MKERVGFSAEIVGSRALKATVAVWVVVFRSDCQTLVIPRNTRLDLNRSLALGRNAFPHKVKFSARCCAVPCSWKVLHICKLFTGYVRLWASNQWHFDGCSLIVMVLSMSAAKVEFWRICQEKNEEKKK